MSDAHAQVCQSRPPAVCAECHTAEVAKLQALVDELQSLSIELTVENERLKGLQSQHS